MNMKNSRLPEDEGRLIGQQLCSVLVAIDYISLKFAKYPLTADGRFTDSALVDIEEGFDIRKEGKAIAIRKGDNLAEFQRAGSRLIELIGHVVTDAQFLSSGELELHFDDLATVCLLVNALGFDSFDLTFLD